MTDCNIVGYGSTVSGNPQCTLTANGWEIVNMWADLDNNPRTPDYSQYEMIHLEIGHGTNPLSI